MDPKADHPQVVLNPFVIYIGLLLSAALLQRIVALPFLERSTAQMVGVVIMVLNLPVGLSAVRGMFTAKTSLNPHRPTTALVVSGSYRFTRNPMYVGLTLLYTGLAFFLHLPWALVFLPLLVWLITAWVIVPEEKYLEQKFGAYYLNYKSEVRRWI